jgi:succinyl-CoA synthetase beta subunit
MPDLDWSDLRFALAVGRQGSPGAAARELGLKVPLVVRLEGTNVELGKKIISESGLNVIPADDLDDAAQKIVKAVKGA